MLFFTYIILAVKIELENTGKLEEVSFSKFQQKVSESSQRQAEAIAMEMFGINPYWNAEAPKTREGFFHYKASAAPAVKRIHAFAPHADVLWFESKTPDLEQAKSVIKSIREKYPNKAMLYNLSPSFNWAAHGFNDQQLKNFCFELGKEGYAIQIISLAGVHSVAVTTCKSKNNIHAI